MTFGLRILLGVAFAALVLAAGTISADSLALRYYEDAVSRFNNGDSKGALIQLKNSLQRDPTQLPARILMGQIQLDLGNPLQAEEELSMAGKLGADRALIALPLARTRNRLGRFEEIVDGLRPTEYPVAIQADLWAELGKARLANKDRVGADIAFAEALKLVSYHEEVMLTRARDLVQHKMYSEAAPLVADMLSRYPENADAWFLMGSVYHARGEFESAAAHYRQASKLDPNHQQAAMGEALILLDWGKQEQGVARLKEIVTARPYSLEALYFYANALKKLGRTAEAKAAMHRASDMVNAVTPADLGDNAGQLLLAANIAYGNSRYESAYGFLSKYLEHEPQDLRANKLLAKLLVRMGKPAEASRLLTRLKVNNPKDPGLLIMLGDVNSNLHDYMAAESYYQAALEKVEANAALIGRLGMSQLRQGQTDTAIDTFERLLEQDSVVNARASLFLGMLYLRDRRMAEAREVVDRIVAQQPDNLAARNLQAAVAVAQGEREGGRRMMAEILRKNPAYRPARINLIKLDIGEGDYAAAGEALSVLLGADPDDQLALRESAQLAIAQGDRRTAIQRLERIRQINPRAVRPILELANLYLAENRPTDALKVAQTLDREAPDNLLVKKGLAMVQLMRGETLVARSLLNEAAELADYNADELIAIARLQVRAGAIEAAEANLRKALREHPGSVSVRLELADLMVRTQRYAEAASQVTGALERKPNDLSAIAQLGDIRLAQGGAEEAIELYRRAKELSDQAALMVKLHRALVRAGRAEQALKELRAWNEAHPDSPPVMLVLADHLQHKGNIDASLALYLRLAELQPQSAVVHNNLANLLMSVDAERALAAALRAHELAPDNASVLDTLGWIRVQLGDLERGLADLREAVARNSRSPTIHYHLAVALEEYGNEIEARREMRQALAIKAPFREREQALQRLQRLEIQ